MRLRQTIRAPSRYEDECELSTGVSPRRLPRRRKAAAAAAAADKEDRPIPYTDYDPNQPPAAFPTLDHPRPAGQTYHSLPTSTPLPPAAAANAETDTAGAVFEADGHPLDAFDVLYRGIPPGQIDNFIASNGPQNPQYMRNMSLLAGEDDDFELEISDDDSEQQQPGDDTAGAQKIHREEPIPSDPQWSDLSLSLQIEIAENMLETHRLSTVQLLLGLSQSDTEQLTRNLHMQNADLEYENRVLEDMRNKQMQALMCLDNPDLKQHSVPARLVMARKIKKQCHRVIFKQSKMRHLLCQAGDLLLARKFLSKRGLPMVYAGEWDNQFVATPSISSTGSVAESLKWKATTRPETVTPTAADNIKTLPPNSRHASIRARTYSQDPFLPSVTEMPAVQLPSAQHYDPIPRSSTQQHSTDRNVQLLLSNQALVRLRIGPKNAARIHIDQPITPSRRRMDTSGFPASPQTQSREPNSDDTIEELPSESDRFDGMHHQYSMPVRRMCGSWSTGASRLQPPEASFSTRPRPGRLDNIIPTGPSTAEPTTRQYHQANRVSADNHPTPDTAHSFGSSPPQPSNLAAMEGVVYGNPHRLIARNAMPTPAASSPDYITTTEFTAKENHIQPPKMTVEKCLATPESHRTTVDERQLRLSVSTYHGSSMPPIDNTDSGNLESASTSSSRSDAMTCQMEPKQKHIVAQTGIKGFSPSKGMQCLNLLPSVSLNSKERAKGQEDAISFIRHQAQPSRSPDRRANEAPQGTANPLMTPQPSKLTKHTRTYFDFGGLKIHADNKQASQHINTSQSAQSDASTGQGHLAAETIGTSRGDNPLRAGVSRAGVGEAHSANPNAGTNQQTVKEGSDNHLSTIPANLAVDVAPVTRKTRQSARKQIAGTKRDASTELKAAQPKRGKKSGQTSTSNTVPVTNATSTPTPNPSVSRGRGRPRKLPLEQ